MEKAARHKDPTILEIEPMDFNSLFKQWCSAELLHLGDIRQKPMAARKGSSWRQKDRLGGRAAEFNKPIALDGCEKKEIRFGDQPIDPRIRPFVSRDKIKMGGARPL